MIATGVAALTTGWARKATPSPAAASIGRSLAPSPTASVAPGARRARPRQALQQRELAPRAAHRLEHPAGQAAARGREAIGLGQIEADRVAHPLDQRQEAARHQRRGRAARAHGLDQGPGAGHQPHALAIDLLEHADRQAGQERDPGLERGAEVERAVHRALRDRGDLGPDAGDLGQLVDAFDRDHGRVHVADQEPLLPVCGRHHRDVQRRARDQLPDALAQRRRREARDRELAGFGGGEPTRPGAERARDRGDQRRFEGRPGRIGDQADDLAHRGAPARRRCAPQAASQ